MLTTEEIERRLREDPDFVWAPYHNNSVQELLKRYPDGVPDRIVASALQFRVEEIDLAMEAVIRKIRKILKEE